MFFLAWLWSLGVGALAVSGLVFRVEVYWTDSCDVLDESESVSDKI